MSYKKFILPYPTKDRMEHGIRVVGDVSGAEVIISHQETFDALKKVMLKDSEEINLLRTIRSMLYAGFTKEQGEILRIDIDNYFNQNP